MSWYSLELCWNFISIQTYTYYLLLVNINVIVLITYCFIHVGIFMAYQMVKNDGLTDMSSSIEDWVMRH